MAHNSPEAIQKQVRTYIIVFAALAVLTVVTVAVSYLDMAFYPALLLAIAIASIKGFLVAAYFMHLISEKSVIYAILLLTVVLVAFCLLLPLITVNGALVSDVA